MPGQKVDGQIYPMKYYRKITDATGMGDWLGMLRNFILWIFTKIIGLEIVNYAPLSLN